MSALPKPGSVLLLECPFTVPKPKPKFLISCGVDDTQALFIVINTHAPSFTSGVQHMEACQVPIDPKDCPCLTHISYANCAEIIDCFSARDVLLAIRDDPSLLKCQLPEEVRQRIAWAVDDARGISPWHKELVAEALHPSPATS